MRIAPYLLLATASLILAPSSATAQDRTARLKARMADGRAPSVESDEFYGHRISGADWVRDAALGELVSEVVLDVTVDPSGAVIAASQSDDHRGYREIPAALLGPVLAAVRRWRFRPFQSHGFPVARRGYAMLGILPAERLPSRHSPFPAAPRDSVSVTFERNGPYGHSYKAVIHGDGRVDLTGTTLARRSRTYSIPIERVDALIAQFRAADFWSLDPKYEDEGITDQETRTITFATGSASRTVVDHAGMRIGMPDAVTQIETAIEDAIDIDRWTIGNARTVAALKQERFDFTSPVAADMFVGMIDDAPEAVLREVLDQGINLDLDSGTGRCIECRAGRSYREAAIENAKIFKRPVVLEWIRPKP